MLEGGTPKKAEKKERNIGKFFGEIVHDILHMPEMMRKLAWVQFFTWIGLFLMWLYFCISVGSLFGPKGSTEYQLGVEWGGLCFATYNVFALIYSFMMPFLAKKITRKWTHILSLLIGAACMMAVIIPKAGGDMATMKFFVMAITVGIGIAWASILTMPYALLSTSIPQKKMGFYMGVFNFFITIPQIISAIGFGWVMEHVFHNVSQWGVACGGIAWIIAAIMMLRVKEK